MHLALYEDKSVYVSIINQGVFMASPKKNRKGSFSGRVNLIRRDLWKSRQNRRPGFFERMGSSEIEPDRYDVFRDESFLRLCSLFNYQSQKEILS